MKFLTVFLIGFSFVTAVVQAKEPTSTIDDRLGACLSKAKIDSESAACYSKSAAAWDSLMNKEYQALSKNLSIAQFAALKKSQKSWMAYRESDESSWQSIFGNSAGTLDLVTIQMERLERVRIRALQLGRLMAMLNLSAPKDANIK